MEKDQSGPLFTILHFNDVYDIQEKVNGGGGIARFQAYLDELRKKHPKNVLLFSGDCFGPSRFSHLLKGRQMEVLNHLKIDAACYGNHQFDFGRQHCIQLASKFKFKWLLGNIKDTNFDQKNGVSRNLGDGHDYDILQVNGYKLGVFGVVGESFKGQLKSQPIQTKNKLIYKDKVQHSNNMCKVLKSLKCDIIIALTHMKNYQDDQLAQKCPEIDIILGGHQHQIVQKIIQNIPIIKSGSNFRNIGVIEVFNKNKVTAKNGNKFNFNITIQDVKIDKSKYKSLIVDQVQKSFLEVKQIDPIIGFTQVKLDIQKADFQQTNIGNFFADATHTYFNQAHCVILNSHTIFPKFDISKGPIYFSQIDDCYDDPIVFKIVYGADILKILKNACQQLRKYQFGRKDDPKDKKFIPQFIFVAGISFKYKINENGVQISDVLFAGNQPLIVGNKYNVAIKLNYFNSFYKKLNIVCEKSQKFDRYPKPSIIKIILKVFDTKRYPNPFEKKTSVGPSSNQIQKQNNSIFNGKKENNDNRSKLLRTTSLNNQGTQYPILDTRVTKEKKQKPSLTDKQLQYFREKAKEILFQKSGYIPQLQQNNQANLIKKVSVRQQRIYEQFYEKYGFERYNDLNYLLISPIVDGRMKRL